MESSAITATGRVEEFSRPVLDPVSPSVCLSICFTWRKVLVCVYAFLHYRDKEASCSTTLAVLGCEAA